MKNFVGSIFLFYIFLVPVNHTNGQVDSGKIDDVKIIVPSLEKKNNSYFFVNIGYQSPSWYRVPMIPENPVDMKIKGNMNVKVPGWFAGIGIMKKTKSRFEVGLLVDYYKNIIPVAYSGQKSTSDWVNERNSNLSYFTENDINRISEVYSFRASVRYKIPIGKFQFWGGIAPGTFSSKIYFSESNNNEPVGLYRETSLGLTFQTGIDFLVKNNKGKDILRFTFFSDFSSPKIEEKMISLFKPGWIFINSKGNNAISPVRLGFAVGIH